MGITQATVHAEKRYRKRHEGMTESYILTPLPLGKRKKEKEMEVY